MRTMAKEIYNVLRSDDEVYVLGIKRRAAALEFL